MLDDACMTLTCKVLTQQQSINSVLWPHSVLIVLWSR